LDDGVYAWYPCESGTDDVSTSFYSGWSSGDTSIVTVDTDGTHTGVAVGSTTSQAFGDLPSNDAHMNCPNLGHTPSGGLSTLPIITSIDPDTVLVGSSNVQVEIDGKGFGPSTPTVSLPQGVTSSGQASTDTKIIITMSVSTAAPVGLASISVTNTTINLTSGASSFTLDGPFYMTVVADQLGTCSGCTTAVERLVTYQVKNFSNSNVAAIPIGENPTRSNWNCNQTQPGITSTPCSEGDQTSSGGQFTDGWSLGADGYTPAGCGNNMDDHWLWCPANRSIGHLSGYVHTNAVSINGVVNPPNQFMAGTVINP
jgi:hypothetical protein